MSRPAVILCHDIRDIQKKMGTNRCEECNNPVISQFSPANCRGHRNNKTPSEGWAWISAEEADLINLARADNDVTVIELIDEIRAMRHEQEHFPQGAYDAEERARVAEERAHAAEERARIAEARVAEEKLCSSDEEVLLSSSMKRVSLSYASSDESSVVKRRRNSRVGVSEDDRRIVLRPLPSEYSTSDEDEM